MRLLIRGMDMPSGCNKCPFHNAAICTAKGSPVSLEIYLFGKKPCDCPLDEIPTPHGDLIDKDSLIDEINHMIFFDKNDYNNVHDVISNFEVEIETEE